MAQVTGCAGERHPYHESLLLHLVQHLLIHTRFSDQILSSFLPWVHSAFL